MFMEFTGLSMSPIALQQLCGMVEWPFENSVMVPAEYQHLSGLGQYLPNT